MNSILNHTAHRLYPPPSRQWLMAQRWCDLLFMHWPINSDILRPLIPAFLEIDTFDSKAWIGVVPFGMENIHLPSLPPVPLCSKFLELNVRTYVNYRGKKGVYFFSLDASHLLAVEIARTFFCLPYYNANISKEIKSNLIGYKSSRTDKRGNSAILEIEYHPSVKFFFRKPIA